MSFGYTYGLVPHYNALSDESESDENEHEKCRSEEAAEENDLRQGDPEEQC